MKSINKGCLLVVIIIAGGTGANLIKEFFGLTTAPLSAAWLSYNIWYMLYGAAIVAAIMWKPACKSTCSEAIPDLECK